MIMQSTREATREELIQRINELQKENKYLRDENAIYRNETVSKSVIRDKIEKLEKAEKIQLKGTKGQDRYSVKQEFMYKINILKELLEEE